MKKQLFRTFNTLSEQISDQYILVRKSDFLEMIDKMSPELTAELLNIWGIFPPDINDEDFPEWVKETRESLDLKSKSLAESAGLKPCDVSYIETGTRSCGKQRKESVQKALVEIIKQKLAS